MKKFTKAVLTVSAVFASVGLGLSIGGVAMGAGIEDIANFHSRFSGIDFHWDDDWDDDDMVSLGQGEDFHDIDELDIELKYDALIMEEYDGDRIRVETEEGSEDKVQVKQSSHKLKIKSTKKDGKHIKIYYPRGTVFRKVELEVEAGTAELSGNLEADELEVKVGAGTFTGYDSVSARKLSVEAGMGSLEIYELSADDIEGECGLGSIELGITGSQEDYRCHLECGAGSIELGGEDYSGLAVEKKVGPSDAAKRMELECGMGSITINFI